MDQSTDTNAAIWKSDEGVQYWTAKSDEREQKRAAQWQLMGELLPFDEQDAFTFLDLGAGTGAAESEIRPFAGRFTYVEFDMSTSTWPSAIPTTVEAVVTSMCIHHLPDHRKQA